MKPHLIIISICRKLSSHICYCAYIVANRPLRLNGLPHVIYLQKAGNWITYDSITLYFEYYQYKRKLGFVKYNDKAKLVTY